MGPIRSIKKIWKNSKSDVLIFPKVTKLNFFYTFTHLHFVQYNILRPRTNSIYTVHTIRKLMIKGRKRGVLNSMLLVDPLSVQSRENHEFYFRNRMYLLVQCIILCTRSKSTYTIQYTYAIRKLQGRKRGMLKVDPILLVDSKHGSF